MYYPRAIEADIQRSLETNPITALLGPRQCGKSTLAKMLIARLSNTIYLDLERPSDLRKLDDPEWFFSSNRGKYFCIDEIQRRPDVFPLIRSLVDEWGGSGHFFILGSASRELLKQSSESLAGRISYKYLTPFLYSEIEADYTIEQYLVLGGFPRSLLSDTVEDSLNWRENFITTFLERDLLQWSGFLSQPMRRLWQMIAHVNGQAINYSALANSLNVSNSTIRNYIELLAGTYMVELIPPYLTNTGKRLIKSPKVYINDAGIINSFLGINSFIQLSGHPVLGSLWETVVLLNLKSHFPMCRFYFYRTSHGAEIDFVIEYGDKIIAVECKASLTPNLSKGSFIAMEDIGANKILVVCPIQNGWQMKKNIIVVSINEAINTIRDYFFK